MEMKIIIATLLSRYVLAFAGQPDFTVEAALNLQLKVPVHHTVRERPA
jgi:hypothetical protein